MSTWTQPQPFYSGGESSRMSKCVWLSACPGQNNPDKSVPVFCHELAREARAHGVPQKHHRQSGKIGCSFPVDVPEIVKTLAPAAGIGEETEIIFRMGGLPVAAQVTGIDCVALRIQYCCQARISPSMFGESVNDLHHRPRRTRRQPAVNINICAVFGSKSKGLI